MLFLSGFFKDRKVQLLLTVVAVMLAIVSTLALLLLVPTGFVFIATFSLGCCLYVVWRFLLRVLIFRISGDRL